MKDLARIAALILSGLSEGEILKAEGPTLALLYRAATEGGNIPFIERLPYEAKRSLFSDACQLLGLCPSKLTESQKLEAVEACRAIHALRSLITVEKI